VSAVFASSKAFTRSLFLNMISLAYAQDCTRKSTECLRVTLRYRGLYVNFSSNRRLRLRFGRTICEFASERLGRMAESDRISKVMVPRATQDSSWSLDSVFHLETQIQRKDVCLVLLEKLVNWICTSSSFLFVLFPLNPQGYSPCGDDLVALVLTRNESLRRCGGQV
jgi:hypothetical protein